MKHNQSRWQAHRRNHWLRAILLLVLFILFLSPLVWTLLASFNIQPNNNVTPPTWSGPLSLQDYSEELGIAEPGFWTKWLTTLSVAATATLLTMGAAIPAAYSLARWRARQKRTLVQSFLILASLPVMAFIIPLKAVIGQLHLLDTFAGLVLAQAALYAPLALYILYGYLSSIRVDLEDTARLEGASVWRILTQIVFPLTFQGVIAIAVIVFVLNWNLLLVPLVLGGEQIKTLAVGMMDFFTFERELEWHTAAAALMVSLLPLLLVIGLAQPMLDRFRLDVR